MACRNLHTGFLWFETSTMSHSHTRFPRLACKCHRPIGQKTLLLRSCFPHRAPPENRNSRPQSRWCLLRLQSTTNTHPLRKNCSERQLQGKDNLRRRRSRPILFHRHRHIPILRPLRLHAQCCRSQVEPGAQSNSRSSFHPSELAVNARFVIVAVVYVYSRFFPLETQFHRGLLAAGQSNAGSTQSEMAVARRADGMFLSRANR